MVYSNHSVPDLQYGFVKFTKVPDSIPHLEHVTIMEIVAVGKDLRDQLFLDQALISQFEKLRPRKGKQLVLCGLQYLPFLTP